MSVAKYYPFNGERGRLRLGLSSISIADWIQYEGDFASRIGDKKKLINHDRQRVLHALPESIFAQQELLALVLEYLRNHKADQFSISADKIFSVRENKNYKISDYEIAPLELVSYLAADDFCLLHEDEEDYKLVAACVCAPTWWDLSEKMNKPLTCIHAPITNLEESIGCMIRHFLKNLSYAEIYQRSNWFLITRPDICVFTESFNLNEDSKSIHSENIENHLYLRTERQTFRKLKKSGYIVFAIKVYTAPIGIIRQHRAIAEDLMMALGTMSNDQKHVLGITLVEEPLLNYLQTIV